MSTRDTIVLGSSDIDVRAFRDGAALAAWATAITMLVGAVMVAGVTMTAVRLRITKWL